MKNLAEHVYNTVNTIIQSNWLLYFFEQIHVKNMAYKISKIITYGIPRDAEF